MVFSFKNRCIGLLLALISCATAKGEETMVRFLLGEHVVEGTPLVWQTGFGAVLARDGRAFYVDPAAAKGHRTTAGSFHPYSSSDLKGLLQTEFGNDFETSGVGRYVVVHPRGARSAWAPRFDELYRSFVRYFTSRGWRPNDPRFPLVAVVFPNERAFRAYASREGSQITANTLGYYSPISNRILLYDLTADRPGVDWSANAETIIHEAAHQAAFNTGVHNRFAQSSRWVVEGLGTMFEAKGIWNSERFSSQRDRMNRGRFEDFRAFAEKRRKPDSLAEFVSSDRMFESDPGSAYAQAWALTFFLSETDPRRYSEFMRRSAAVPSFTARRSPERLQDFTAVFGEDLKLLEAKFLRFMRELK